MVAVAALVLLGGLVLLWAVPQYTGHEPVVVMARPVKAGQVLTAADVTTADVSVGSGVSVVRPQDGVLGRTALSDLPAGAVLSPGQVGDATGVAAGQNVVPVRLKLGQRPQAGLTPGQKVLAVPAAADPSSAAGRSVSQAAPISATVASYGDPDPTTGDVVADLTVPAKDAVGLAKMAATGSVVLVLVPGAGS